MAITKANHVSVDLSNNYANIAAIETALAAAVTALAAGFFPQELKALVHKTSAGGYVSTLQMTVAKAPYLKWLATTAVTFKCIDLGASSSVANLNTAIQTIIDTQEAASKFLMDKENLRIKVNGSLKDIMILLFSNGNPPVS